MKMPAYWLPRPAMQFDAKTESKLEQIYEQSVLPGKGQWIRRKLPVPTWQFLCWLTDVKGLLVHGTGDTQIRSFEPRQPSDAGVFGNQKAVYAASDGIWAMFFAVINRPAVPMFISNASVRLELPSGGLTQPYYFFSMSDYALAQAPWRGGVVYVLPRDTFKQEAPFQRGNLRAYSDHWASLEAVKPLAKIRFAPEEFPFLDQIRSHDDAVLIERIKADPNGFPWVETKELV